MARGSDSGVSVLVIDPDAGIRLLVEAVLQHAGFRTVGVDGIESVTDGIETFAVIVRDLNLRPAESRRVLEELAATPPALLQRTVLMTTSLRQAVKIIDSASVFSIVGKPFDVEGLAAIVRDCAKASGQVDRRAGKGTRPFRTSRDAGPADSSVKLDSLQRFVTTIPSLQRLLAAPVQGERDATLRADMRRTLGVLSVTLMEASHGEESGTRAAVFRAASIVAGRLATGQPPLNLPASSGHDH